MSLRAPSTLRFELVFEGFSAQGSEDIEHTVPVFFVGPRIEHAVPAHLSLCVRLGLPW